MFTNVAATMPDTGKDYDVCFDTRSGEALAIAIRFERNGRTAYRTIWERVKHGQPSMRHIEIIQQARDAWEGKPTAIKPGPKDGTISRAIWDAADMLAKRSVKVTQSIVFQYLGSKGHVGVNPDTVSTQLTAWRKARAAQAEAKVLKAAADVVPAKGTPARVVWDTIADLHKTNDVVLVSEVVDAMRKAGHKTTRFPIMPTMRAWHQHHENKGARDKVQKAAADVVTTAKELRHEQDALKLAQQAVREGLDNHARAVGLPRYSDLAEALERLLSLDLPDMGAVRTARKLLAKVTP